MLKCYPKYLLDATTPKAELKRVLKVLEKYNLYELIEEITEQCLHRQCSVIFIICLHIR